MWRWISRQVTRKILMGGADSMDQAVQHLRKRGAAGCRTAGDWMSAIDRTNHEPFTARAEVDIGWVSSALRTVRWSAGGFCNPEEGGAQVGWALTHPLLQGTAANTGLGSVHWIPPFFSSATPPMVFDLHKNASEAH